MHPFVIFVVILMSVLVTAWTLTLISHLLQHIRLGSKRLCKIFNTHVPDMTTKDCVCKYCKREILVDSQGNYFASLEYEEDKKRD